tara:strand:- start:768 stop:1097 length:330 start_codon:yes stop_codon:yes gene_type:complete
MAKEKIENQVENQESLKDIKEEVVKERPEKVKKDHLDQLQKLVQSVNSIQYNVGKLEAQKHTLLHNLSITQDRIGVFQDLLKKEYGTFDVQIEDGTINYPDKDISGNEE